MDKTDAKVEEGTILLVVKERPKNGSQAELDEWEQHIKGILQATKEIGFKRVILVCGPKAAKKMGLLPE